MKKIQKGQSLFEVVLAIAVLTLVLGGLVSLATVSVRNSTFSRNKTLSSKYAQEASEWLRSERDTDKDLFIGRADVAGGKYCLKSLVWTNTGACTNAPADIITDTTFKRDLTLSKKTVSGKTIIEANVVVSWKDAQGSHESRSETYFSDWREI